MRTSIVALLVVAALGGGALLWRHPHQKLPTVGASPAKRMEVLPRPRTLPMRGEVDLQAAEVYKRSRLAFPESFDKWMRREHVTTEQMAQTLQVLADAQAIYDETEELRDGLRDEAQRMRDSRMTLEQRLRYQAALHRRMLTQPRQSDEELIEASRASAELSDQIDQALEATAPPAERAAFAAAEQVTKDLEAQVLAEFAAFLTPRQIEAFVAGVDEVQNLLATSYRKPQDARSLSASTVP